MDVFHDRLVSDVRGLSSVLAVQPFNYAGVAAEIAHDHRTLQQNFTRLCVYWLETLAKQEQPAPENTTVASTTDDDSEEDTENCARVISKITNNLSGSWYRDFAKRMLDEPTIAQQSFTRLCGAWFEELARAKGSDLRNEASVNLGKEFVATVAEKIRNEAGWDMVLQFVTNIENRSLPMV